MSSIAHKRDTNPITSVIASYLHPDGRIGVLVELTCESETTAKNPEVRAFAHELAMHIAVTSPKYVKRPSPFGNVPTECVSASDFLYEQQFVRDSTTSVSELMARMAQAIRERLEVRRFVRFQAGEPEAGPGSTSSYPPSEAPESPVERPQGPKQGASAVDFITEPSKPD